MQATHEQLIAHALERIEVLEQQVLALQGQLARAVSLAEGGMAPAKRGPGRPKKSASESGPTQRESEEAAGIVRPVTFGDAARATDA
jgi:hypothetical protein